MFTFKIEASSSSSENGIIKVNAIEDAKHKIKPIRKVKMIASGTVRILCSLSPAIDEIIS
jgi:hypothetical protein